jgi:hypothetical protein
MIWCHCHVYLSLLFGSRDICVISIASSSTIVWTCEVIDRQGSISLDGEMFGSMLIMVQDISSLSWINLSHFMGIPTNTGNALIVEWLKSFARLFEARFCDRKEFHWIGKSFAHVRKKSIKKMTVREIVQKEHQIFHEIRKYGGKALAEPWKLNYRSTRMD